LTIGASFRWLTYLKKEEFRPEWPSLFSGELSGERLRGKGFQTIPAGDRLVVLTPGGAGIGDPRERDRAALERDTEEGLVSGEAAKAVYGGGA